MKKQLLIASLLAVSAASVMAQGTVSFKTSVSKNPVFFATDGTTASLALVPTTGQAGSYGTVSYEIYAAPNGTAAVAGNNGQTFLANLQASSTWAGVAVGPVAYSAAGVINPGITVTLPASAGGAGNPVELEIVAYTGTLANPTSIGYSGATFNAGSFTFSGNGLTYSTGSSAWSQATGNPAPPTPTLPGTLVQGAAGFGALVLTPVPEPTTIALGGLGAAALLLFRRRK